MKVVLVSKCYSGIIVVGALQCLLGACTVNFDVLDFAPGRVHEGLLNDHSLSTELVGATRKDSVTKLKPERK